MLLSILTVYSYNDAIDMLWYGFYKENDCVC